MSFSSYEPAPPPPPERFGGSASGPRAGFWQRFGAYVLDTLLLLIPYVFLLAAKVDATVAELIYVVLTFGYFTYLEGGASGRTLGKQVVGIRVYDFRHGGSIGYGRAFLRQFMKSISALVILLGYLWMLWDKEKQTWHDKIVGAVVVPVEDYPVTGS